MTLVWTDKESADIVSMYNYFVLFFTCWCLLWLLNKIQWDTFIKSAFLVLLDGILIFTVFFRGACCIFKLPTPKKTERNITRIHCINACSIGFFLCAINPVLYFVVYIATFKLTLCPHFVKKHMSNINCINDVCILLWTLFQAMWTAILTLIRWLNVVY